MSLGYAEKLSFIEDVGQVGMAEFFDPSHVLQCKVPGVSNFCFLFLLWGFVGLLDFFSRVCVISRCVDCCLGIDRIAA